MAYKSIYNDIIFIEGNIENFDKKENVSYSYGSIGSQLKSLTDVKKYMSNIAKNKNCNCVINFKYGQKSSWFSIDDTKWYGKGEMGNIPEKEYINLIKSLENK